MIFLPLARPLMKSSTLETVRLKQATVNPLLSMFRMRFSPMTARPMRPMSACAMITYSFVQSSVSLLFHFIVTNPGSRHSTRKQACRTGGVTDFGRHRGARCGSAPRIAAAPWMKGKKKRQPRAPPRGAAFPSHRDSTSRITDAVRTGVAGSKLSGSWTRRESLRFVGSRPEAAPGKAPKIWPLPVSCRWTSCRYCHPRPSSRTSWQTPRGCPGTARSGRQADGQRCCPSWPHRWCPPSPPGYTTSGLNGGVPGNAGAVPAGLLIHGLRSAATAKPGSFEVVNAYIENGTWYV